MSATTRAPQSPNQTPDQSVQDEGTQNPSPQATESSEESNETTLRPREWVLQIMGTYGPSANGTDDGQPFATGRFGALGDYFHTLIQGSALYRAHQYFRVGPQLSVDHFRGDNVAYGSDLTSVSAGITGELNLAEIQQSLPVHIFPHLRVGARLGIGFGTTTSEQALLEERLGPSLGISAALDVLCVPIEGVSLCAGLYGGTHVTYDMGDTNQAHNYFGAQIAIRSSDLEEVPETVPECPVHLEERLQEDIQSLADNNAVLREENNRQRTFLASLQGQLEDRGVTRESLLSDIRSAYAEYLLTREDSPVEDEAEAIAQAEQRYSDDFDPFALLDVEEVAVPEQMPEDCDELYSLQRQLQTERADLMYQKGVVEGSVIAALIRLGVQPSAAPELTRVITRLQEIHFMTNRPFGAQETGESRERGYIQEADIRTVDAAVAAYQQSHPANQDGVREALATTQIEDLFARIFPRTRRADGSAFYSPSLEVIQEVANSLNAQDMRSTTIFVVGHTDSRGSSVHNQGLSDRRARAIRDALVLFGVNPERIHPVGQGENDPVYYFDRTTAPRGSERQDGSPDRRISREETRMLNESGVRGNALTDEVRGRQTTNRRIEMFICFPDTEDQACSELAAGIAGQAAPQTEGAASDGTVQTVTSETETEAPRRRRRRTPEPEETPTPPVDPLNTEAPSDIDLP